MQSICCCCDTHRSGLGMEAFHSPGRGDGGWSEELQGRRRIWVWCISWLLKRISTLSLHQDCSSPSTMKLTIPAEPTGRVWGESQAWDWALGMQASSREQAVRLQTSGPLVCLTRACPPKHTFWGLFLKYFDLF